MNFQKISPEDMVNKYKDENLTLKNENEWLKQALEDIIDETEKLLRENQALNNNFNLNLDRPQYYLTYTTSSLGSFNFKKFN